MSNNTQLAYFNLLCFDEAHHATKSHPYALLMREFYFQVGGPALCLALVGAGSLQSGRNDRRDCNDTISDARRRLSVSYATL